MRLAFLLHFYQPFNQQKDILHRIIEESYRPLITGLLRRPNARIVININGSLIEMLDNDTYQDILDGIKKLYSRGQIELTTSAMYHSFLPLLPRDEIVRQMSQNNNLLQKTFTVETSNIGIFPPEMAVSDTLMRIFRSQNVVWVASPELANVNKLYKADRLYKHSDTGLSLMFRHKRVSSLILSSVVRDAETLIAETKDLHDNEKYWFCVMDAETFGHHRIGHEKVLFDILDHPFFTPSTVSDILSLDLPVEPTQIRSCTWTNSEQDFHLGSKDNSFILWNDPSNPIHKLQWQFTRYVIKLINTARKRDNPGYAKARKMTDKALSSDQFWWASVKPWWSLEMVEQGAYSLLQVVRTLYPDKANKLYLKGETYYRQILDKAFFWQRSGYIRDRHLQNSSTYMQKPFRQRAPAEWFNQIVLEFEDEMNKATKNKDFERAIKWRDALLKIRQNTDIHDVLHVVDELWSARKIPELKPFLTYEWEEFSEYAKQNFKDAATKEDFEKWKKEKSQNLE